MLGKREEPKSKLIVAKRKSGIETQILFFSSLMACRVIFFSAKEPEVKFWIALTTGVKTLSELLLRLLPDFWKLAVAFMDGKIQKATKRCNTVSADPQRISKCLAMVRDIIDLYSSQMTYLLVESLVPDRSEEEEEQEEQGDKEPNRAKSAVVEAFFLGRIITEVSNCMNDVNALGLRGGSFMILTDMIQQVRWNFVDYLCMSWAKGKPKASLSLYHAMRATRQLVLVLLSLVFLFVLVIDAKIFFRYEDWTLQSENSQITLLVSLFYQFHEHCLRSAYKYASIWTASTEEPVAGDDVLAVVNADFTERIRKTFLDALYSFLDGLVHLAFSDGERTRTNDHASIEPRKQRNIDFSQLDPRILVTISNLNEVGNNAIPKLLADFERTCGLSMAEDGKVSYDLALYCVFFCGQVLVVQSRSLNVKSSFFLSLSLSLSPSQKSRLLLRWWVNWTTSCLRTTSSARPWWPVE